ncbi:hypothetical protein [Halobacillus sp. A5]|uniref:hypothetical protein n=1 Tax=Halobacillus sp. A5 TaxID=2880263 RepID=UPI0020A6CD29|nr:hypothetical protein [Halobacillus sp. A5]MCP3027224.1 hypothetical protein [Halobacillus sp. A5]
MLHRLQAAGVLFIVIGFLLWVSVDSSGVLLPLLISGAGIILVSLARGITRRGRSFLCRIGLHKNKQTGWDASTPSAAVYQCERCGQKKRVVKAV